MGGCVPATSVSADCRRNGRFSCYRWKLFHDGFLRMKAMPSIEDLRQRARRNVPKMFFDYADAGSYNQETLRANRSDMERIKLRQRVLRDIDRRSTATTILGEQVPLPLALGPI